MKVIEILKLNRELLKTCHYMGIRPDDVQYIELYNEYNKDIVAPLSLRYGISERKVYDLIKRFKTDCNLCAV
jgi:hypothetical protein